jgi:hypothetical protein
MNVRGIISAASLVPARRADARAPSDTGGRSTRTRRRLLGAVVAFVLLVVPLTAVASPASATSLRYSGTPGSVSFKDPVANMGVYGSGQDNLQLLVGKVGASSAAGQQYAQVYLRAYYSCSTGWCTAASTSVYTGWFSPGQSVDFGGTFVGVQVPTGRYYTWVATTTWYNANRAVVGQETYYPTAGTTQWFSTTQWYDGSHDFACVAYAYQNGVCRPYGLAGSSFSPTGSLYTLYAG